jgi:D-alanine-D-alanine ligase-like ATP-grasp enzyme
MPYRELLAPSTNLETKLLIEYVAKWPQDMSVGCFERVAHEHRIKTKCVWMTPYKGKLVGQWLKLKIGKRTYIYRNGVLRVKQRRRFRTYWKHINGQLPRLTVNKQLVKEHLLEHSYSVPEGRIFTSIQFDEALTFFKKLGQSVCVKPNKGTEGHCVTTRIKDDANFKVAFELVAASYSEIIVEEYIEGDTYRFFYVKPNIVGVLKKELAYITGDGQHTLAELVSYNNQKSASRRLPSHWPIPLDNRLIKCVNAQGFNLSDVIESGKTVFIADGAGSYDGGRSVTCREKIHPSYLRLFKEISSKFPDMRLAAYDVILREPESDMRPENYKILEVNSAPGFLPFYLPTEGEIQDVCSVMLERMKSGEW